MRSPVLNHTAPIFFLVPLLVCTHSAPNSTFHVAIARISANGTRLTLTRHFFPLFLTSLHSFSLPISLFPSHAPTTVSPFPTLSRIFFSLSFHSFYTRPACIYARTPTRDYLAYQAYANPRAYSRSTGVGASFNIVSVCRDLIFTRLREFELLGNLSDTDRQPRKLKRIRPRDGQRRKPSKSPGRSDPYTSGASGESVVFA